jgi:regulator of sigma E protease
MSNFFFYALAFVGVISALVVVHELGHYLVARWCGVKVLRFSFGFGPVIFLRQFGVDRTEWALAAFPLGGFVRMLDEREGEVAAAEAHRAYNRQSVGKRSMIVAAGPVANFVLAVFILWVCFMIGSRELRPVLGSPPEGTPAAVAGILNGEEVRRVDGQAVATMDELRWLLLKKAAEQEQVDLETINEQQEINLRHLSLAAIGEKSWVGDGMEHLGIRFYRPKVPAVVGQVIAGKPGELAGLRVGDILLALDGHVLGDWRDFVEQINASPGRSVHLEFARASENLAVDLIPEAIFENGKTIGKVGIGVRPPENSRDILVFVSYGPLDAVSRAFTETWEKSIFTLRMMGRMLTGEVSWKNLSGPVTIADYAGQSAKLGLDYYLKFMAMVSISLGVLNLLPVPVLDGGHLMYHMFEVVRRRPLTERAMEIGQRIGLGFLVILMAFAFFNDMNRLFAG